MHFSEQTEISFPAANRSTIQLLNAGTELIAAGSAVAVLFVEDTSPGVLCAVPATSDEELWGIAAENIIPGTYGNVVLAGIVKAFIYGGSGNYAVPSVNGLTAGDSGKAQIICCGTPETPGIVLLGGGGRSLSGSLRQTKAGPLIPPKNKLFSKIILDKFCVL